MWTGEWSGKNSPKGFPTNILVQKMLFISESSTSSKLVGDIFNVASPYSTITFMTNDIRHGFCSKTCHQTLESSRVYPSISVLQDTPPRFPIHHPSSLKHLICMKLGYSKTPLVPASRHILMITHHLTKVVWRFLC